MRAIERQKEILEYLNTHRTTTASQLAAMFGVSRRTIDRDIFDLSLSYPIFTNQGYNGGITVASDWYLGKSYLHPDELELLKKLRAGLQPADAAVMDSILKRFTKPNTH